MDLWTRRLRLRADLDGHLAHLVPDVDGLLDALAARRLAARPVVRFVDGEDLARTLARARTHTAGRRFSGCGLAFRKERLVDAGARPAIYQPADHLDEVPADVRWRVVPLDVRGVDWSHEREWRMRGDLVFDLDEATVVLDDDRTFVRFAREARGALGDLGVSLLAPRQPESERR